MEDTRGLSIWKQTGPEMYFESVFHGRNTEKNKGSNHVQMPVFISE